MNKRIFLSLLIIAVTLLISYNTSSSKINFNEVLNTINSNNEKFRVPDVNVEDYVNSVPCESFFNIEDIKKLVEKKDENKASISKDEALKDIDFLFNMLKNNYGLYTYLGGDSIFLSSKEKIVNRLDTDIINIEEFYNMIIENLNFINDNHFIIKYDLNHEKKFAETSFFYLLDKEYYYKDDNGFFINDEKEKKYILSINDDREIEKYMNLSIDDNGELVYKIGKLLTPDNDKESLRERVSFDIDVKYKLKDNNITEKKTLIKANYLLNIGDVFSINVYNNIPVVSLRSFSLDDEIKEKFLQSAFECKNYDINILDLRGNTGGDGDLVVQWLENRFGFRPVGNSKKLSLNRFLTDGRIKSEEEFGYLRDLMNLEFKDDYYYTKDSDSEKLYDNDSLIFVLMDVNQGSAGEMFVEYIKNYENIILVGTNTSGTIEGGSYGIDFKMPNSEIHFQFGPWINLYDKEYFRESVGYKPDIWVNGNDALDKSLELIKYYNLTKKN